MTMSEHSKDYWLIHSDCIEETLGKLPEKSMSLAIFSPPFPSVFSYSEKHADMGNSEDLQGDALLHFSFFLRGLVRVMLPGRVVCIHCTQIGRRKSDGEQGIHDFRGFIIRLAERTGLIYEYDWLLRQGPQGQAIRTRKIELKFQGLESDRTQSRGALSDYIIKFRAPGVNAVKVNNKGEVSRNDWIAWAESCWDDIDWTDTLNYRLAKGSNDTRHICPLALEPIRRLIKLFSMPGETVLDPFAGVGSTGHEALLLDRKFVGVELKDEYILQARNNLESALRKRAEKQQDLFSNLDAGMEETPVPVYGSPPEDRDE